MKRQIIYHFPLKEVITNNNKKSKQRYVVSMQTDKKVTLVSPILQFMNRVESIFMNHSVSSVFGNLLKVSKCILK